MVAFYLELIFLFLVLSRGTALPASEPSSRTKKRQIVPIVTSPSMNSAPGAECSANGGCRQLDCPSGYYDKWVIGIASVMRLVLVRKKNLSWILPRELDLVCATVIIIILLLVHPYSAFIRRPCLMSAYVSVIWLVRFNVVNYLSRISRSNKSIVHLRGFHDALAQVYHNVSLFEREAEIIQSNTAKNLLFRVNT